jgi:hypothetical protein
MLLLAALNPGLAAIWLSRDVLLSAERWPKETQLTLLKPTPPIYVATGDDVLIEVKVTRGSPTSVVLDSIVDGRLARSEADRRGIHGALPAAYRKRFAPFPIPRARRR